MGYIFIDIYNDYSDENGFLDKRLSDGNVHIYDSRYLENFLSTVIFYKFLSDYNLV